MRLEGEGQGSFVLGVTAVELSTLIAAVRVAADVLDADERTPPRGFGVEVDAVSAARRA